MYHNDEFTTQTQLVVWFKISDFGMLRLTKLAS